MESPNPSLANQNNKAKYENETQTITKESIGTASVQELLRTLKS
jgi:hypothetical protein